MLYNWKNVPKYTIVNINITRFENEFEILHPMEFYPIILDYRLNLIDLETGENFDLTKLPEGYPVSDLIFSKDQLHNSRKKLSNFGDNFLYHDWIKTDPISGLYVINWDPNILVYYRSENKQFYDYDNDLDIWVPFQMLFKFKAKFIKEKTT